MLRWLRTFLLIHHPNVIKLTLCVHVVWGGALIYSDAVGRTLILVGLDKFVEAGMTVDSLGIMLLTFSALAVLGLVKESEWGDRRCFALIMPQYFLMMAQFGSDLQVIFTGYTTASGNPVDPVLVFTILAMPMLLALFHTWSVVERWVLWPRDTQKLLDEIA